MRGSTYEDKKKSQNDGRRRTPKDVHNERDIRAPMVVTEKPKSREATKQEVSANNRCSYEAARELFDVRSRLETFRTSVPANRGRGRPELFSEMMILYGIEVMGFLNVDYRKAAGIVAALLEQHGLGFPSYSRFYERVARAMDDMVLGAPVTDGRILCRFVMVDKTGRKRRLIIDSTGLTLTNITIWRKTKWKNGPKYRGWLKLHALTDLDTNGIVAFVLTKDDTGDEDMLEYLLEMADMGGVDYDVVYADGAYSSVYNFELVCRDRECRFITSFKSNTRAKNLGSLDRGEAARLWCELPYREWTLETSYHMRWKIESAFSDFKRLMSEFVRATTDSGMVREVVFKVQAYNYHKRVRAEILGTTGNGVVVGSA